MKERGVFEYVINPKHKKGIITEKYIYDIADHISKLVNKDSGCVLCVCYKKVDYNNVCSNVCHDILEKLKNKLGHCFFICPIRFLKDQELKEEYEKLPPDFQISKYINEKPRTDI